LVVHDVDSPRRGIDAGRSASRPVYGAYEEVGLDVLGRGWFNLDLGRSLVLIASAAITLFTAI
jgi:hypothetical protein